jgi:hypothetical protein
VAVELIPPSVRRRLHSQIADVLKSVSSQGDRNWPIIAGHYERANRIGEAVTAYQRASRAARHVGALSDAMTFLSRALNLLDRLPEGRERHRREINLRLRHGFLVAAAEGPGSPVAAADFERCLELGGTDPLADELFATLMALFTYYVGRGDLRRSQRIVESLRVGVENGREWWLTENIGGSGTLAWLRGDFLDAKEQLEQAAELMKLRGQHDVEAEWFMPHDPVVLGLCGLAHARWIMGDLAGADEALDRGAARIEELVFPQGPFSLCYLQFIEVWLRLEAGQYERGVELAAQIRHRGEQHGFDQWTALGASLHALATAMSATAFGDCDSPAVAGGIDAMLGWTAACRYVGALSFLTSFDGYAARLLIAAGRLEQASAQIDSGLALAKDTGMHYYDAELLRLKAAATEDPAGRSTLLSSALAMSRKQHAPVFALRAAVDDYKLRGHAALPSLADAVKGLGAESTWPELAEARALLARAQSAR